MKVILEISEEDLAAVWHDTLGDKDTRTMQERLQDIIESNAAKFRGAFQTFTPERQVEIYRLADKRLDPPRDELAELMPALRPVLQLVRIHDADTLGMATSDAFVVATAQGGWSAKQVELTLGQLRALSKAVDLLAGPESILAEAPTSHPALAAPVSAEDAEKLKGAYP